MDSQPWLGGSQSPMTLQLAIAFAEKYMNANLSHELWQDIKIGILRKQSDCQSPRVYLQRLIVWWMLFNFGCFLFLKGMLEMLYGRWTIDEGVG